MILSALKGKTLSQIKALKQANTTLLPSSCFSINQLMSNDEMKGTKGLSVTSEHIQRLCTLSRVTISSESQLNKLTKDINNIILCLNTLESSPVTPDIIPMYSPMQFYKEHSNRWREDTPFSFATESEYIQRRNQTVLSNANTVKAGYFVVPKVK
ncbi:hypothetical protein ABK040_016696 [Willaertia magna]